ncbi:hypothetical protein U0070_010141 [Myodes glareolus]|uniref:Uncharacterized protein n=1 Tax=Myodes glareolus TaxID=447135 RepID=A0AAW0I4C4_MYOGA
MESGRRAGGGGAEVGAQPPLFPSPSVPSSEHKAERARSGGPAPQESACAEYRGRGWEPNFFLPQNGHGCIPELLSQLSWWLKCSVCSQKADHL